MDDLSVTSSARDLTRVIPPADSLYDVLHPAKMCRTNNFLRSFSHKFYVSIVKIFHNEDWDEIESIVEFMPVDIVDLCAGASHSSTAQPCSDSWLDMV